MAVSFRGRKSGKRLCPSGYRMENGVCNKTRHIGNNNQILSDDCYDVYDLFDMCLNGSGPSMGGCNSSGGCNCTYHNVGNQAWWNIQQLESYGMGLGAGYCSCQPSGMLVSNVNACLMTEGGRGPRTTGNRYSAPPPAYRQGGRIKRRRRR